VTSRGIGTLGLIVTVGTSAGLAEGIRARAVLVGISQYRHLEQAEWLRFAGRDANSYAGHLSPPVASAHNPEAGEPGWMEPGGGVTDLTILIDNVPARNGKDAILRPATSANMSTYIRTALLQASASETVYLFVSARGLATTDSAEGYILGYDSPPEKQKLAALRVSELQRYLRQSSARRVVLFADVCRETNQPRVENRINLVLAGLAEDRLGLQGVLASEPKKTSREDGSLAGGHGVFTYYLVNGLNGEADKADRDGIVTLKEIIGYVQNSVTRQTKAAQKPVQFGTVEPDLPLSRQQKTTRFPAAGQLALVFFGVPGASGLAGLLAPPQAAAVETVGLIDSFSDAIRKGNLLGPDGALNMLSLLQPRLPKGEWLTLRARLSAELEGVGQQVVTRYGIGDMFPRDAGWRRLQSDQNLNQAGFERAAAHFAAARGLWDDDPVLQTRLDARASFCRGRVLTFARRYAAAADALKEALRLDPEFPECHNAFGIVHLETSAYEQAAASFRSARDGAPAWAYPRHNLALTHIEQGDYSAAEREYVAAIRAAPFYPYLIYNYAVLLQRLGRRSAAEEQYKEAEKVFLRQESSYERRADEWTKSGNAADAKWAVDTKAVLERNRAEVYNALGALWEQRRNRDRAIGMYEKALDLNRHLVPARHNLAMLYRELARTGGSGQLRRAMDLWQENVQSDPEFQPSAIALAETHLQNGNPTEARHYFELALCAGPENVQARLGLARALLALGDSHAAVARAREALDQQLRERANGNQRNTPLASSSVYRTLAEILEFQGLQADACKNYRTAQRALGRREDRETRTQITRKVRKCRAAGF
jgi:tetratricopeptide (TPR) repeat protein